MMRRLLIAAVLGLGLGLSATLARAQQPDSTQIQEKLDSTVFMAEKHTSVLDISPAQPIVVNTDLLRRIPSITGTPDPLRFVRLLPGVQTGMDLDAGLHIFGTENSHSLVSVSGVPVYGANHILGLFSTFIPSHFREMSFSPFTSSANRLGGTVDMQLPDRIPQRFHGRLSVSLFEAEGTLDIPTSRNSALFVSLRRSFINLLYGSFLRMGVFSFKYGFTDGNATWYWTPGKNDRVWADFMMSGDDIHFHSDRGGYSFQFNWTNLKGSVHHNHKWDWGELSQRLYYTRLNLNLDLKHDIYDIVLPSLIGTAGYSATLTAGRWKGEFRVEGHHSRPQQAIVRNKDIAQDGPDESQMALETSALVEYTLPITRDLELAAQLKGIWWMSADGAHYPALAPQLRVMWDLHRAGKFELLAGLGRQNIFQTGTSSIGLPVDFWYLAGKNLAPQGSRHASLSWGRNFLGERYSVAVSAFYRHLTGQIDYTGTIIDYLDPDYRTANYIRTGYGQNYGACLTLHNQAGAFTGWVNYTFARSLRTFDGETFPSNHERIHEFNAVANYTRGHWDFGGVLVLASGTPYNVAESFIMSGGTLITEMSPRNAYRLRPYVRMDLSVTYFFRRKADGRGNGITFAMYNVLGYKNDVSLQLSVSKDGQSFSYQPMALHLRWLPSLSYFHNF